MALAIPGIGQPERNAKLRVAHGSHIGRKAQKAIAQDRVAAVCAGLLGVLSLLLWISYFQLPVFRPCSDLM